MKKLISIILAAVLLTTTACAFGNKVVSIGSTTDNTKGVLPIKAALVEIEAVAVVE